MQFTRKQLNDMYHFSRNSWERRKDEFLDYLNEYINITEYKTPKGRYYYEVTGDLPESIPDLPRKSNRAEKEKDYSEFTIASLGVEFKPNSANKIARDAIDAFGDKKYGHSNEKSVGERYVKPTLKLKGERSEKMVWVYYSNYEIMDEDALRRWRQIMAEERINEQEQANAFRRQADGEDVTEKINSYKEAKQRFKEEFGDIPVTVYKWKLSVDENKQ